VQRRREVEDGAYSNYSYGVEVFKMTLQRYAGRVPLSRNGAGGVSWFIQDIILSTLELFVVAFHRLYLQIAQKSNIL